MTFGSLFTGIGGFDLGFELAGLECKWQVETDKNCQKVLSRHWPNVEKFSDVREYGKYNLKSVDIICGGFPCQDVSIAGRRAGLDGERSGLWYEFVRIIDELKPRFAVIENVPGLLSSDRGKDFAVILRGLVKCGYGVAWRIFDAQYDGVAQGRRRVFIVGSLGAGSCCQILFESEGVSWNTPTRREAGTDATKIFAFSAGNSGDSYGIGCRENLTPPLRSSDSGTNQVPTIAMALNAHGQRLDGESETFVTAKTLTANYGKQIDSSDTNGGPPNLIVNCFNSYTVGADDNDAQGNHIVAMPLLAKANSSHDESLETYIAWNWQSGGDVRYDFSDKPNLTANQIPAVGVRRLTPRECERLQAFPDDFTRWDADGNEISDSARYRMLGNAVCVNSAKWIGERLIKIGKNSGEL